MHKIKVFLGGYVNYLNAQNINCRALSEQLDRNKFKISTMLFPIGNAKDFKPLGDVKYIKLRRPVRLMRYWSYLKGISGADVAFLPKEEIVCFSRVIAKIFRSKLFCTVEGMIDDWSVSRLPKRRQKSYINSFAKFEPHLYAITKYIAEDVGDRRGYKFNEQILYLGVDSKKFINTKKIINGLNNIVFIGFDSIRKNIYDLFDVAKRNKNIRFHIIGGNDLKGDTVEDYIRRENLTNVTYYGRLDHAELSKLLKDMDLMYFPSRSEGFPKVHLETACAGVPTMCYPDYGAEEWIKNGVNGIIVNNKEEADTMIKRLKEHPEELKSLSKEAIKLGMSFDWDNLVKIWEKEIEKIYNEK